MNTPTETTPTETTPANSIFPIRLRASKARLQELADEEYGSFEDYGRPDPGVIGINSDGDSYICEHPVNICARSPFEIRNQVEFDSMMGIGCLDNSIDKAQGNYEYSRGLCPEEDAQMRGWLNWLISLQTRLGAAYKAAGGIEV